MREAVATRAIDFRFGWSFFRGTGKLFLFAIHALIFLSSHSLIVLLVRNDKARLRLIVRSNTFHAGLVLKYLGVEVFHDEDTPDVRGKLIICNHLSYLDVLVLFTRYPALFITSKEIERAFFLGQITKLAGCFFVERRKERRTPETAEAEVRLMKQRLAQGLNVFLFPEGTSSEGRTVLPFKANFFQLAIDTKKPIQPVVLKYLGHNRKLAPWFGDAEFLPHFFRVCSEKEFSVSVLPLEKIFPEGKDRYQLKEEAHARILEAYEGH